LLHAAYKGNIDFKTGERILYNVLNIRHVLSVIKFILADEVDMLSDDWRKAQYLFRHAGTNWLIKQWFRDTQRDRTAAHGA
jgi:hypothetical protein